MPDTGCISCQWSARRVASHGMHQPMLMSHQWRYQAHGVTLHESIRCQEAKCEQGQQHGKATCAAGQQVQCIHHVNRQVLLTAPT